MIINYFNRFGAGHRPTKANPELLIYPDTVLAGTVALEGFESIAGRHPQIFQPVRDLQLPQLASRDNLYVSEPLDPIALRERLRVSAFKRLDHGHNSNAMRD